MANIYNINFAYNHTGKNWDFDSLIGITDSNWNNVAQFGDTTQSVVDTSLGNSIEFEWDAFYTKLKLVRDDTSNGSYQGIPENCWDTTCIIDGDDSTQFSITGLPINTAYTADIYYDFPSTFGQVGYTQYSLTGAALVDITPSGEVNSRSAPVTAIGTTSATGEIVFQIGSTIGSIPKIGLNAFILTVGDATTTTGTITTTSENDTATIDGAIEDTGVGGYPIREVYSGEPITILTIDQDTCALSWGEGLCTAGLYNVVPDNQNYGNTLLWDLNDWSYVGPPSNRPEFTKLTPTAAGNLIETVTDLIYPEDLDMFFSVDATSFSGNIDEIRIIVETVAGFSDVVVNLLTGSFVNGSTNSAFDSVTVTASTVPNYFIIEAKVLAANVPETGGVAFEFLDGGAVPAIGEQGRTYGLQAAAKAGQEPILTSGTPKFAQSTKPCFNTRGTCQDGDNYSLDTLPLNFVKPRSSLLRDDYYIPSLSGVSIGAAKLNPGGANKSASAFGQRAVISASFKDHPHNDLLVDQYRDQRDYDPLLQGSFWSKWRARNPYYMHRFVTLKTGYIENGALIGAIERSFVMTGFSGPDSAGNVAIKGKDILTIAENVKSQAPAVSTGKLDTAILAGDLAATLTPTGIGDLEYPVSGSLRMEREVMQFTRIGDALTFTARGVEGTTAAAHDDNVSVQICLVYTAQKPQDILYDLLLNYAGIPAIFLDKAGWDAEQIDYLPHLYTTIIAEPEGVAKLISEMCQQMYFSVWWDERSNLVRMRAVRSAQDDLIFDLDDNKNFIADSVKWKDLADQLITQVWVYYGQIDPTEKLDKASNYAVLEASIDLSVEDETKQGIKKIQKIYSRWISQLDAGAAVALGGSILDRYANIPREVSFKVDAKDGSMWLGDFAQVTTRLQVDQFGAPQTTNIQIYQAEETVSGSVFSYTGQQFIGRIGDAADEENALILGFDTLNVNLRTWYESQRGVPDGTENITFIIRSGVTVGGDTAGGGVNILLQDRTASNDSYDAGLSSISGRAMGDVPILQRAGIVSTRTTLVDGVYAGGSYTANWEIKEYPLSTGLVTGDWSDVPGVILNLIIESGAAVLGEGGNGSAHSFKETIVGSFGNNYTTPGGDGGHAMKIEHAINITNAGIIAGGGGGGGNISYDSPISTNMRQARGGGGAGLMFSSVGSNIFSPSDYLQTETQASGGSKLSGGTGSRGFRDDSGGVYYNSFPGQESASASGGGLGEAGQDATFAAYDINDDLYILTDGTGGIAGEAITVGASLVTWINKGDVRGVENI